jgi:Actin
VRQTYVLPDYANSSANDLDARYGRITDGPAGREHLGAHLTPSQHADFIADLSPEGDNASRPRGRKQKESDRADDEDESGNAEEQQMLHLSDERFQLHEILFNPGSLGLEQCSLGELVKTAITKAAPQGLEGMFYANILLIGGMAQLPGLKERLEDEVRPFAPDDIEIRVEVADEPALAAAQGAASLCTREPNSSEGRFLASRFVTVEDWREQGQRICRERFRSWNGPNDEDTTNVDGDTLALIASQQRVPNGRKRQSVNQAGSPAQDGGKKKAKATKGPGKG